MCSNFLYSFFLLITYITLIKSSLKFNIPTEKAKCFQIELYNEGTLLVRYDINGLDKFFNNIEQSEIFSHIKIFVKNENEKHLYETEIKRRKDKIAVYLKETGFYQICTRYYKGRGGKELPDSVVMGIKIRNDDDKTEIDNSLQKDDINNFWKKIKEIKKDMKQTIQAAKKEIKEEDKTAKSIIDCLYTYYKFCVAQLVLILILTAYMIYNYKDFLKQSSII